MAMTDTTESVETAAGDACCRPGGDRQRARARVRRIAGQVTGIQRMIEEDRYCIDILHQIAAVRSALDGLGVQLLTDHLESCVLGHGTDTEHAQARSLSREDLLAEVRNALTQFLKS